MNRLKIFSWICVFFLLLVCCHKDTDEIQLTTGYLGTLTLEYSRTFPPFSNIVTNDIDITKAGIVTIDQPEVANYDATDEVAETVKLKEKGSVTVSNLKGTIKYTDEDEYVVINAYSLIKGETTVWGWDDDLGWIFPQTIPFEVEDPIENPLNFNIAESTLTGDDIDATVAGYMGNMTFRWSLILVPKLTK